MDFCLYSPSMGSEFLIYKASAGSGKTYSLTRQFLLLLFDQVTNYKRTLAVTFTNKAAIELKSRILEELVCLAKGDLKHSEHGNYISHALEIEPGRLIARARNILQLILFDYSRFSIGTIDEFFQHILRVFSREVGLFTGYEIELNTANTIDQAIERVFRGFDQESPEAKWIISAIQQHIDNGYPWKRFENDLKSMGHELLKENLSIHFFNPSSEALSAGNLLEYKNKLDRLINDFQHEVFEIKSRARQVLDLHGLSMTDFFGGRNGPVGYLSHLDPKETDPKSRRAFLEPEKSWVKKKSEQNKQNAVIQAVKSDLFQLLVRANRLHDEHSTDYLTANLVVQKIPSLAMAQVIANEIIGVGKENRNFLLALTNPLIRQVVADQPTPYLYEKMGVFFDHFMIDEFQDTSVLQWQNFLPLINDSIASGGQNLLVGDIKQSIYRWRNSSWELMAGRAKQDLEGGDPKEINLEFNFRSRPAIIEFNNIFFEKAHQIVTDELTVQIEEHPLLQPRLDQFKLAYAGLRQKIGRKAKGGLVQVSFTPNEELNQAPVHYQDLVKLTIELQSEKGYQPGDIVFLVRNNKQCAELIRYFDTYATSNVFPESVKLNLVSTESYRLNASPVLNCLACAIALIHDRENLHILGKFAIEYARLGNDHLPDGFYNELLHITQNQSEINKWLGKDFDGMLSNLDSSSLQDCLEVIISFLELTQYAGAAPFLIGLKQILLDGTNKGMTLETVEFYEWWESTGSLELLPMTDASDTLRVMTIHKAKGLEFPVVIMPEADWNLDHNAQNAPVLWLEDPFGVLDEQRRIPVSYQKNMVKAHLSAPYLIEKMQVYLDNLNLLYVAFTRAIDMLYVFTPEKNRTRLTRVAGIIDEVLNVNLEKSYWFGDADTRNASVTDANVTDVCRQDQYPVGDHFLAEPEKSEVESAETRQGKIVHELLSHLNSVLDIDDTIDRYVNANQFTPGEGQQLNYEIKRLVNNPLVSNYYSGRYSSLTERSILLNDGSVLRPDQVFVDGTEACIIEYKTGKALNGHKKQVRKYCKTLKSMGYQSVKGFLLYLKSGEVIEVVY